MNTAQYLDAAKKQLRITSDYALAQQLGIEQSKISNWRSGRNFPNAGICIELAGIIGNIEPVQVIADVEIERARAGRNVSRRQYWERIRSTVAALVWAIGAASFGLPMLKAAQCVVRTDSRRRLPRGRSRTKNVTVKSLPAPAATTLPRRDWLGGLR